MATLVRHRAGDQVALPFPGVTKEVLWRGGDGVAFERFSLAAGTLYPDHAHQGWEMMFVLSGRIDMGGGLVCGPGDFLMTQVGERHAPTVLEDADVLFGFDQRHKGA
jgi:anti-sigma factor ChrR (cupin superfamily)